jgi:putative component of membrane protein insertase Oxa1/YidC/SpoIIIJ protein YidD
VIQKIIKICMVLLLFGLLGLKLEKGACGDPFDVVDAEEIHTGKVQKEGNDTNVGVFLASFFSKHISAVDGDRCPSAPTCSSYSVQAFRKHGLVMGWLMTVDRLIHEGDEWHFSPVEERGGKGKIIDPVENNDYWWRNNKSQASDR